jgi:hypothetical protein
MVDAKGGRHLTGSVLRAVHRCMSASFVFLVAPAGALALPSFAIQTDQPCSACHVSAFGPRLTQAGRDFKLYGYVANDTKTHSVPISILGSASFTHKEADQLGNEIDGYNKNDNVTFNQVSAFYGGAAWGGVGAFAELAYDAIENHLGWEDLDVRYAKEAKFLGTDAVLGVSVNNSPTVTDLWDSSPAWVFPFTDSAFVRTPSAAPLIEKLPSTVIGIGGYAMLNDTLYVETDIYGGLDRGVLRALGGELLNEHDRQSGAAVYWRALLQHDFDQGMNYAAIGTYGLTADVRPFDLGGIGTDSYTDIAFDATYQFVAHPERSTSDMVSLHALYLHEHSDLPASRIVLGTFGSNSLSTLRLDVTYAIAATYSATVQRFQSSGSLDPVFWDTASGRPDSRGWILELDYVPWGKPDSPLAWLNGRLALQYIAYERFDGDSAAASDNDTLLLSLTLGAALNR